MAHPSVTSILRFFEYGHLPEHLQAVSRPFCLLAHDLVNGKLLGAGDLDGPELTVALRKLLESKDAAVRAALPPA